MLNKLFLTCVFLILSISQLFIGISDLVFTSRATSWPRAVGTITHSHVAEDLISYTPQITYTYQVGSTIYTGHRISTASPHSRDKKEALAATTLYPAGRTVTVLHHPLHPRTSLLEIASPFHSWYKTIIGILALTISILAGRSFIHTFRREHRKSMDNI